MDEIAARQAIAEAFGGAEDLKHREFSGDRLQSDFKQLEKVAGGLSAEGQLLQLKQKMGVLPPGTAPESKQLGAGKKSDVPAAPMSTEEVLAAEIEELSKDRK